MPKLLVPILAGCDTRPRPFERAYGAFVSAHLDGGLALESNGTPTRVLRCLDLEACGGWSSDRIDATASALTHSPVLTIALAASQPPRALAPLVEAATLTLCAPRVRPSREMVPVPDPVASGAELQEAVLHTPRGAVALGQLLRQTAVLPSHAGLAAEAAVYSMLLNGTEFRTWLASSQRPDAGADAGARLVRVERSAGRLDIILDRPERRNAMSFAMREQLYEALEMPLLDPSIAQVWLSGAGSAFCSGGDLAEFGTARDLVAAYLVRLDRAPWRLVDQMRERIAVHVQGAAVGAGVEIAAFAGRATADPEATFRLPELRMGLVPGAGGTVSVVRRIGRWRAAWMMLTGATVATPTARSWGLVDAVCETP